MRLLVKKWKIAVSVVIAIVALWIAYSANFQTPQNVPPTSTLACPNAKDLDSQESTYLKEDSASHTYTIYLNITLANTLKNQFIITSVDVSLLNVTFPNGTVLPTNEGGSSAGPRLLNPGQWTSINFTFVSGVKIKSANLYFLINIQGCHTVGIGFTANLP